VSTNSNSTNIKLKFNEIFPEFDAGSYTMSGGVGLKTIETLLATSTIITTPTTTGKEKLQDAARHFSLVRASSVTRTNA
jgi:hypothetical protein